MKQQQQPPHGYYIPYGKWTFSYTQPIYPWLRVWLPGNWAITWHHNRTPRGLPCCCSSGDSYKECYIWEAINGWLVRVQQVMGSPIHHNLLHAVAPTEFHWKVLASKTLPSALAALPKHHGVRGPTRGVSGAWIWSATPSSMKIYRIQPVGYLQIPTTVFIGGRYNTEHDWAICVWILLLETNQFLNIEPKQWVE